MKTCLFTLVGANLAWTFTAKAQLLFNTSFESPQIAANTAEGSIPASWTGNGSYNYIINGDYSPGYPFAKSGLQYAAVGFQSSISQSIQIQFSGNYTISWYDSSEYNEPTSSSPYSVSLEGSNGTPFSGNYDSGATSLRSWKERSFEVFLVPDNYTLTFAGGTAAFGAVSLIDNLTVVPEPAEYGLLFGIAALVGGAYLRNAGNCKSVRSR